MKTRKSLLMIPFAFAILLGFTLSQPSIAGDQNILTIDRGVRHISTVPAIKGQEVFLFVREKVNAGIENNLDSIKVTGKVVLFVHGGSVPVVPGMDLPYKDYSWAEHLAKAGFNVFMMDVNGYGFSPRPLMTNPCNTSLSDQALLIPNPLSKTCNSEYLFQLNTIESERDEINTVVDFIKSLRGVDRISLIGWSGGGLRTGSYTSLNPDKVEKLIILASSTYARAGSSLPPAKVPASGYPLSLQSYEELVSDRWFSTMQCANQAEPGIENVAWEENMRFDPLGSTWGTPAWNPITSPTGGMMRVANRTNWGWNSQAAGKVTVPTLIMVGENDGLYSSNKQLFEDLGTERKVFLGIACATHFVVWERQHTVLQEASKDWLLHESVRGVKQGILSADENGNIHKEK